MHASLNEDLIQPGKLEMGISHRNGGRTRHFDWGRHETTPDIASNSDKPTSQHSLDENRVYSVLLYCLASHPIQFERRS